MPFARYAVFVDEMAELKEEAGGRRTMKRQDLKEIIEWIQAYLEGRPEVTFAYLFGSWARGTANPLSDIDVAIYVDEEKIGEGYCYGYKAEVMADLMEILKTNWVDLVILNAAPPLLGFQVVRYGIPLICRSEVERDQFLAKTREEYEKIRGLLNTQIVSLSQRVKEGKFGRL
ncbi:MAG: nucleotidyltransferase domain-containing protein [Candidatus Tectomicrobia bacterium]|nr:nucleotidyltransferase domain-containing protein [Candidatus Tectomicrobia bacterium]